MPIKTTNCKYFLTKLNTKPDIPSKYTNFDYNTSKLREWSQGYENKYQDAISEAGNQIKRISFSDFLNGLKKCIDTLPQSLLRQATVLVSEHKSNKWVAEIANNYFPKDFGNNTNFLSLGHEDANDFVMSLNQIPTEAWPNDIVLFDDGGFSGKQMTRHVKAIAKKIGTEAKTRTTIFVVIPFMTNVAKELLTNIKFPKNIKLSVHTAEIIPTAKEILSKKCFDSLNELCGNILKNDSNEDSGIATTYFDHKIPNSQSFLFSIIARETMPSIKPPYITKHATSPTPRANSSPKKKKSNLTGSSR